jgi:CMP-N-acetylneuraminic acid synthetase/RimJ/RimL family protein N-acetyltransferase
VTPALPVRLRPATPGDLARLWEWRNDVDTRRASFDETPVSIEAHTRWLEQTLGRPDRRLYVATSGGEEVGTARLDIADGGAEVSVTVSPAHRGRGLGPAVLEALARQAFGPLGLSRLVARVKRDNAASRAVFARAGYLLVDDGPVQTLRRLPRRRLALIPARGGSKRFPRKNLALFDGVPLLVRTIETARAAEVFDRILVSTEDAEIALVAKRAGADVHTRPATLAADDATLIDVCLALLHELEAEGEHYEALCLLLPTAPFRQPRHVTESLQVLETQRAHVVMSVSEFPHVPAWAVREERGFLRLVWGRRWLRSRTALPTMFRHNGVVLWARTAALREHRRFYTPRLAPYHMSLEDSVDVDHPLDLEFAEFLRRRRQA